MARESEFLSLSDQALRAVIGPNSRHVALIEDAFKVLIEAPGGGVSINGGARDRANAKQVVVQLAERVAKWWVPDDVVFVDSLPVGGTGKVQKNELRKAYGGHVAGSARTD